MSIELQKHILFLCVYLILLLIVLLDTLKVELMWHWGIAIAENSISQSLSLPHLPKIKCFEERRLFMCVTQKELHGEKKKKQHHSSENYLWKKRGKRTTIRSISLLETELSYIVFKLLLFLSKCKRTFPPAQFIQEIFPWSDYRKYRLQKVHSLGSSS